MQSKHWITGAILFLFLGGGIGMTINYNLLCDVFVSQKNEKPQSCEMKIIDNPTVKFKLPTYEHLN